MELVGAISLLLTYEDSFYGRSALLYQDNSSAFHAMVSGGAKSSALAAVANVFHCALAGLNANVWIEHANTKAMVADIPSRMQTTSPHPDTELFRKLVPNERTAVFPSPAEWENPILLLDAIRLRRLARLESRKRALQ